MTRRTWIPIAVVAAQVLVLVHMAAEREWVIRTGETVLLRTAPVDPRDPMRGDYVRLDYDISEVPEALCRDGLVAWFAGKKPEGDPRDLRVYAVLRRNSSGVAELEALTDVRPAGGLFIRGRVDYFYLHTARVRYGIEALFMQQGTARELELARFKEMEGVPLDGEVALRASDGLAVLKGRQWEPLGLRVTLDRREPEVPEEAGNNNRSRRQTGVVAATLELKNHSDRPLAIVDRAGGRSFRLVRIDARWRESSHCWVGEDMPVPAPRPGEVVLLEPGKTHTVRLDLTTPEWFVTEVPPENARDVAKPTPTSLELAENAWNARFRFEYVAPSDAEADALPHADALRRMHVRTRAFTPTGSVD